MAGELNIPLDENRDTGLTVIASVWSETGTQQGADVTLTETGAAFYSGDFDVSTLADGKYFVRFYTSTRRKGGGFLFVRNGLEVSQEQFEKKSEADTRQTALIAEHDATQERTDRLPDKPASYMDVIVGNNA